MLNLNAKKIWLNDKQTDEFNLKIRTGKLVLFQLQREFDGKKIERATESYPQNRE